MDPITQGALGASMPQSVARPQRMGLAMLCGVLGGMAPDLDVLVSSSADPLLFLEYHRQFTHSLVFIPFGALLVASALWFVFGRARSWPFGQIYVYCFLGYATHGLLDACTTYGTLLLWPFSDARIAWNNISIVDPLFTVPLLVGVILARWRRSPWPARLALAWGVTYLGLGAVGRDMAAEEGLRVAHSRGHSPEFVDAKPSFANLVLWKTIYREGGRYFVDAIRIGSEPVVFEGESVAALDLSRDFPWLDRQSLQGRDVERFRWFSAGYLAADPEMPDRIIDLRYSLLPNEIKPLWGIQLFRAQQNSRHVDYVTMRSGGDEALPALLAMIFPERDR
ncbi:MAG: metal-dependent hydrolase [Pseudomonadota bacterium]